MIDARIVKRLPGSRNEPSFLLNIHLQTDAPVTVLLGPSGAGKTLTLNCLAGFTQPDEGRIVVQDHLFFDASARVHVPPHQRRCGYIFQDHTLFPHMSVWDNLKFAVQSMPAPRPSRREQHRRIHELLEAFELSDMGARKPHQLSGGQKQRVSIARALIGNPRLLLLDEPTRGLNVQLRESFYEIVAKARDRLKSPIVIVTHDIDECYPLADKLYLLDNGKCLQAGRKEDVIAHPASMEMVKLLGIYVVTPAQITFLDPGNNSARLRVAEQEFQTRYLPGHLLGDRGWLCVRRSELKLAPDSNAKTSDRLMLDVTGQTAMTSGVRLHFAHGIDVDVSEAEFGAVRGKRRLSVEIPRAAAYFLSN